MSKQYKRGLVVRKFMCSYWFGWIIFLAIGAIILPDMIAITSRISGCYGCERLFQSELIGKVVVLCITGASIVFPIVFWKMSEEPDPLEIAKELKLGLILFCIWILIGLPIASIDIKDNYAKGYINYNYISQAGYFSLFTLLVPLQILKSIYVEKFCESKKEKENFAEISSDFEAYMKNAHAQEQFKLQLMSEFCMEIYYFWREIKQWQEEFNAMTDTSKKAYFLFIIENFILPGAIFEVNLKENIKTHFKQQVKLIKNGEGFEIYANCFDEALQQVLWMLLFGPFFRFCSIVSTVARNIVWNDLNHVT